MTHYLAGVGIVVAYALVVLVVLGLCAAASREPMRGEGGGEG